MAIINSKIISEIPKIIVKGNKMTINIKCIKGNLILSIWKQKKF
jgi:hypothetical protein